MYKKEVKFIHRKHCPLFAEVDRRSHSELGNKVFPAFLFVLSSFLGPTLNFIPPHEVFETHKPLPGDKREVQPIFYC